MVLGCLRPTELRLVLEPGVGMLDGGVPIDVPASAIPPMLRCPNALLWVELDGSGHVLSAEPRGSR